MNNHHGKQHSNRPIAPSTPTPTVCHMFIASLISLCVCTAAFAGEIHVSVDGNDGNNGSRSAPFRTISAAAEVAQPGDTVIVHEGTYREHVNPPRGGTGPDNRIVYRAAEGADVTIKGSEPVEDWTHVEGGVWKTTLPNSFFGDFNPFALRIKGHWFDDYGAAEHRAGVFINGTALDEVGRRRTVLNADPSERLWYAMAPGKTERVEQSGPLLNVSWFQPDGGSKTDAASFAEQKGIKTTASSEGGQLIGWIEHGDRTKYEPVDFGGTSSKITFRVASDNTGGLIEIHRGSPDGPLLGTARVPGTGGWQKWTSVTADIKPTSGKQTIWLVFQHRKADRKTPDMPEDKTIIWANFGDLNPNEELVEVTTEPAVLYPEQPGRNYISVRGFTLSQAATQWAPPTEEQIGLIGTHWSKGWVIENNTIRNSRCTCLTLGKYDDDLNEAQSAAGYVETIKQAIEDGWSRQHIGSHVVRNNHISHCGEAGIVGSMGGAFSTITDNVIHSTYLKTDQYGGAEMAGIKLHGAVDTLVARNHIYNNGHHGIWIDWMAQGTRLTRNLLHGNQAFDVFSEVNHGPYLVDHNLMLSNRKALRDWSQGGAYVHNLIHGKIASGQPGREVPYLKPHRTDIAGIERVVQGGERYYNNIFVGHNGLTPYNGISDKGYLYAHSNLYLNGAKPSKFDYNETVLPNVNPEVKLKSSKQQWQLKMHVDTSWLYRHETRPVTTNQLEPPKRVSQSYAFPDGSPVRFPMDYLGRTRDENHPAVGPFEFSEEGTKTIQVWPVAPSSRSDRHDK